MITNSLYVELHQVKMDLRYNFVSISCWISQWLSIRLLMDSRVSQIDWYPL